MVVAEEKASESAIREIEDKAAAGTTTEGAADAKKIE